jgi:dynactin complex subunit
MASKFKLGQEVIVSTKEIPDKKGVIRFMGKIEGRPDDYVGVELD